MFSKDSRMCPENNLLKNVADITTYLQKSVRNNIYFNDYIVTL